MTKNEPKLRDNYLKLPFWEQSSEEQIAAVKERLKNYKKMTAEEEIEYDAEGGYFDDD